MTKDEALKMAIEAIEFEGVRDSEDYWLMMDKVRTACKEALAQPAPSWRRLSKKKLEKIYGDSTKIDWYAYEAIDKALQKLNPIGN